MHDVFISHSTKDKEIASSVCDYLEGNGVRCWIAPRDIDPGQDWAEAIVEAIGRSKIMLLIFSAHANDSTQINREISVASEERVPIVPFRIEDIQPSKKLRYYLSTPHWLDALPPPAENHFDYLGRSIRRFVPVADEAKAKPKASVTTVPTGNAEAEPIPVKKRDSQAEKFDKEVPPIDKPVEIAEPTVLTSAHVQISAEEVLSEAPQVLEPEPAGLSPNPTKEEISSWMESPEVRAVIEDLRSPPNAIRRDPFSFDEQYEKASEAKIRQIIMIAVSMLSLLAAATFMALIAGRLAGRPFTVVTGAVVVPTIFWALSLPIVYWARTRPAYAVICGMQITALIYFYLAAGDRLDPYNNNFDEAFYLVTMIVSGITIAGVVFKSPAIWLYSIWASLLLLAITVFNIWRVPLAVPFLLVSLFFIFLAARQSRKENLAKLVAAASAGTARPSKE
jgi:hypothetical protein